MGRSESRRPRIGTIRPQTLAPTVVRSFPVRANAGLEWILIFLRVEAHLACDGRKTSIVFERIEPRIHFDRQQLKRSILAGFRQPVESEIGAAKRKLDDGEFEGGHVAALR